MKRSEINEVIREMERFARACGMALPPFCSWTPERWKTLGAECDEIRDAKLGWDITDYGLGDFSRVGFALVTLRNGCIADRARYPKPYAEKLLMLRGGQTSPMHFHWNKMEDIIHRGGAPVFITVYASAPDETLSDADVTVRCDGCASVVPAGTRIRLEPGQSITIPPYLYHDFQTLPGAGLTLLGEVSMCNDDENDNRFLDPVGRFPEIEEDEPPYRLLCSEYPPAPDTDPGL